jgi:ferredoxin-fold anticodon binding domain-containing protein
MANFTIYTMQDGTEIKLKLTASGVIALEEKLDSSIQEKLTELVKLSVASEIVAAAIETDGKATALKIYDDMIERGQTLDDYHKLIFKILCAAGFLKAAEVEKQLEMTAATEKMQGMYYNVQMKSIEQQTAALEAKTTLTMNE